MSKLLSSLATLFFILWLSNTWALPLFYKCENQRISETIASSDYNSWLQNFIKASPENRANLVNVLCDGKEECMKRLGQVATMAQFSQESALKIFQEVLDSLPPITVPTKLSLDQEEAIKGISAIREIRACQETQAKLPAEDFVSPHGVKIFYPYYSNYMYVTGCSGLDTSSCFQPSLQIIRTVIRQAMSAGADPYAVLALNSMEGTPQDMGDLYLDPIGLIDIMGCPGKQVSNGANGAFHSYGTSFLIDPKVVDNPSMGKRLEQAIRSDQSVSLAKGSSYFCKDLVALEQTETLSASPKSNACCLKLPFKSGEDKNTIDQIEHSLVYEHIKKITATPYQDKKDPAWMLQRYNGFTDLMGAAEGVSNWRAGVNYYKTPTYGMQAMDFYINAYMLNPLVQQEIEAAQANGLAMPENLLCKGLKDGTYFINTKKYFEDHRDAKRMEGIYQKFKNSKGFYALTSRESRVLMAELKNTASDNPDMPKLLSDRAIEAIMSKFNDPNNNPLSTRNMEVATLEEFQQNLATTSLKLAKSQIMVLHQYALEKDSIFKEIKGMEERSLAMVINLAAKPKFDYVLIDTSWPLPPDEKLQTEYQLNHDEIQEIKEYRQLETMIDKKWTHYLDTDTWKKYPSVFKDNTIMTNIGMIEVQSKRFPPFEKVEEQLSVREDWPELKADVEKYYVHLQEMRKVINWEKVYQTYFKDVYPKRQTLGTSSKYPWREFTNEEVQKLGAMLNPPPQTEESAPASTEQEN